MQKIIISATVFFISLSAMSCHKKSAVTAVDASSKAKEVTVDPAANISETGAAYHLDSLAIKGDVLSLFVNYSGGCKEHVFELISNGMYAKSMPPQLSLCLKHTNNLDNCKKLVTEELKFNISKVKFQGSNSLTVKLGDKSVIYKY